MSNRLRVIAQRKKKRKEGEEYLLSELEEGMQRRMRKAFLTLLFVSALVFGFAAAIVYESVVGPYWFGATVIGITFAWMIFIFLQWPGRWLTLARAKYAYRFKSYLQAMWDDILYFLQAMWNGVLYFLKLPFRNLITRG